MTGWSPSLRVAHACSSMPLARPAVGLVPMAHAEHGRQVHHDTGLLTVGQVVRVCARPFSHQLLAVAHHLQLDRQPVALGVHAGHLFLHGPPLPAQVLRLVPEAFR